MKVTRAECTHVSFAFVESYGEKEKEIAVYVYKSIRRRQRLLTRAGNLVVEVVSDLVTNEKSYLHRLLL